MTRLMELMALSGRSLKSCRKTLNEVFYGFSGYGLELESRKEKGNLNNLLMLITFGDLVGIPIFPPYYSMRLLPHIMPFYQNWRRNLLREKDLTDILGEDI
jgi:hypothetical protein